MHVKRKALRHELDLLRERISIALNVAVHERNLPSAAISPQGKARQALRTMDKVSDRAS